MQTKEFNLTETIDLIKARALNEIENIQKCVEYFKEKDKGSYEILCILKEIQDLKVGGGIYSLFERYNRHAQFSFDDLYSFDQVLHFIGTLQDGDAQLMIEEATNYLDFNDDNSGYQFFTIDFVHNNENNVMYLNEAILIEFLKLYLEREKMERKQCDMIDKEINDNDNGIWGKEYSELGNKIKKLTANMNKFIQNENKKRQDRMIDFK